MWYDIYVGRLMGRHFLADKREDGATLQTGRFQCAYRATRRAELTKLLTEQGCRVEWLFPEETGFYQPIVVAKK